MSDYEQEDIEKEEAAGKTQEQIRQQELEDIRVMLRHKTGQRFFKRFFQEAGLFTSTFTGNSTGYFLEGQRNLGLKFFADVAEACPERIPQIVIEVKKEPNQKTK